MRTMITRPVIKRCPYVTEVDAGTLCIVFNGAAPELHGLAATIDKLCAEPITHEDFTAALIEELPDASEIVTTWTTGPWAVEVSWGQQP